MPWELRLNSPYRAFCIVKVRPQIWNAQVSISLYGSSSETAGVPCTMRRAVWRTILPSFTMLMPAVCQAKDNCEPYPLFRHPTSHVPHPQEILGEFADVVDEQQSDSEDDDSVPPPAKHAATATVPGSTAFGSGGGGGSSSSLIAPAFGGGTPDTAAKQVGSTWGASNAGNLDAAGFSGSKGSDRSFGGSNVGRGGFAAPRSWNAGGSGAADGGMQADSIEQYKSSLDNGQIAKPDGAGATHSQPAAGGVFSLSTSGGGPMPLPEAKAGSTSRASFFGKSSPTPATPAATFGATTPKVTFSSAAFGGSGSGMGFRGSGKEPFASQTAGAANEDAAVWKQVDGSTGRASSPGMAQAAASGSGGSGTHPAFGDSSKKLPDFSTAFTTGGTSSS